MRDTLQIDSNDSVRVALRDLSPGEFVDGLTIQSLIPAGHKVANAFLAEGTDVLKYGYPIGRAKVAIAAGEHVHTHNLLSALTDDLRVRTSPAVESPKSFAAPRMFDGYRRPGGRVGVRNEIWIVPTVGCVNQASMQIATAANAKYAGRGVDAVVAYPHPFGCSQLGGDLDNTRRVLAGMLRHPNAGAVLVIGLGCENNQMKELLREANAATDIGAGRLIYFNAQEVDDEIARGIEAVDKLFAVASRARREPVPASELILAMKCGGSDGFSGITANPLVGQIADRLTAQGGTTLLSEVPEMFGAEQILLDRAADEATGYKIISLVNNFREYFRGYDQPIDENPSPGNKAGGLSSNADKSLGCLQKAGHAPVREVLRYGEPATPHLAGVALVNAPGNDGVSSTAMIVAGAQIVLFTTGRGTPMGFPAPTLKIASNTSLAQRKPSWIDFSAGRLIDGDVSAGALADELFDFVLDVASGRRQTRNEINGNREIAIWKDGVTL